jgi:hypothetical protein
MTPWEVTVEDINLLLAFHGVSVPGEQVHELLGELDTDAITDDLSSYEKFGDEFMSVLSDIEDQLVALGIIDSDKLFEHPGS